MDLLSQIRSLNHELDRLKAENLALQEHRDGLSEAVHARQPASGREEHLRVPITVEDYIDDGIDDPMDDVMDCPTEDAMDDPIDAPMEDAMDDPTADPIDEAMDEPMDDPIDDPMDLSN